MSLFDLKKERLIYTNINNIIIKNTHSYQILLNTLKLVNPLGILDKGYSLVTKDNIIVKNASNICENDIINIRLHKGKLKAEVREVNYE